LKASESAGVESTHKLLPCWHHHGKQRAQFQRSRALFAAATRLLLHLLLLSKLILACAVADSGQVSSHRRGATSYRYRYRYRATRQARVKGGDRAHTLATCTVYELIGARVRYKGVVVGRKWHPPPLRSRQRRRQRQRRRYRGRRPHGRLQLPQWWVPCNAGPHCRLCRCWSLLTQPRCRWLPRREMPPSYHLRHRRRRRRRRLTSLSHQQWMAAAAAQAKRLLSAELPPRRRRMGVRRLLE